MKLGIIGVGAVGSARPWRLCYGPACANAC
jgi:hypothetical protein